ncbi:MAG: type II toxin-antitoxin system RelE/ParE family toxin [Candidatus Omnitrophica bacterium]|nr:type II toxin-antitoxin system RelE/ParE family toxin [Candidatus Omnitrophota bacterium]
MYNLRFLNQAEKAYRWLQERDRALFERIHAALERLRTDPSLGKRLGGPLREVRSLRVGMYRILYHVRHHELLIYVIEIGHRREVYR